MAAAYAFFVQSLLIGILGASVVARAATGEVLPGYELCLTHNDDTAPARPDNPVEHSSCMAHCLACVAGGHAFMPAPATASPGHVVPAVVAILWATRDWQAPRPRHNPIARPRGPPLAA